jgi:hypothetical protein
LRDSEDFKKKLEERDIDVNQFDPKMKIKKDCDGKLKKSQF